MPTDETIRKKTNEGSAGNIAVYDAAGNPITSLNGALAIQLFHEGVPYQATGGGGVTWPLSIDLLLADPAPVADKVLFYALSDGNPSPNNQVSIKYLYPDGQEVIVQVMVI